MHNAYNVEITSKLVIGTVTKNILAPARYFKGLSTPYLQVITEKLTWDSYSVI